LFELGGVDFATAKEAMRLASYKLPFDTRFIAREVISGAGTKVKELNAVEN
jgi:ribosomal protein L16/L10AE